MAATSRDMPNSPMRKRGVLITPLGLKLLATAVLVFLVAWTVYRLKPRVSDTERGTALLVEAFSKRRLIEPRLSGGFKGGEFRPPSADDSDIEKSKLERAGVLIMDAVDGNNPSAELWYARLLLSKGEKFPEALRYLKHVLAVSESAEAHNDLGVCLIQQGKLENALDEFEAARKLKPDMPEALFNRGLCYQRLMLREPARVDFDRCAEIEQDKSWRSEARGRAEGMSRSPTQRKAETDTIAEFDAALANGRIDDAKRIADQNSEVIRKHAFWEVTIQHLRAAVAGDDTEAERALFELDLIGRVLYETRKDSSIADVAKYLRELPEPERELSLSLTRRFVELMKSFRPDEQSRIEFERLEQQFREQGNHSFQVSCAFEQAECYYHAKRFRDSIEKLQETLSLIEQRDWLRERAKILNLLALEYSRLDQDSLAIKYSEQAISLCDNSPSLEAKILQYMSAPYLRLGDFESALARLRGSTALYLEKVQPPDPFADLAHNYAQIAYIYSLQNQHLLALYYAEQSLVYSDEANQADYAAEFSSFIAVQHARLNQFDQAEAVLSRSFDYLGKIGAGRQREYAEANVLINAGEVAARRADVARALECYDKAEALLDLDEGHILPSINILRDRARVYEAAGQNDRAHADLMRAVDLIESSRENIEETDQRIKFLAARQNTFDQLISLDANSINATVEAFDIAERSRARALLEEVSVEKKSGERRDGDATSFALDRNNSKNVKPLTLTGVRSGLPADLTLLEYVVTDQRTYLFLVSRSRFKVLQSSATTVVLDRLVHDYVADLRRIAPLDELNAKARVLYDYLIKPAEAELRGFTNLCIVPDEALHFLPFAALVDQSDRYVVESHRLTYAPSASVLVRCLVESRGKQSNKLDKILAVGNPEFDRDSFPDLQPLPEAEEEAVKSARYYSTGSVVLTREKATEPAVLAAMKGCEVVDLALHCVVGEGSPGLAALVLAGASPAGTTASNDSRGADRTAVRSPNLPHAAVDDPNDGLLFLGELYRIRLPHTKLAVLSACQSGLGQYYRGEGIVSLIRPFLTSGVPTVVASLWPVSSRATAALMIDFHGQRQLAGMKSGDALRTAQIDMRNGSLFQHPYYWAPFIPVGAGN